MPKLLLFLGILMMLGCRESQLNYPLPNKKDIDAIIKTVVAQDSLFKNRKYNRPLSVDLQKIKIYKNRLESGPALFDSTIIDLNDLMGIKIRGQQFFKASDIAYFAFQNDIASHYEIPHSLISRFKLTTLADQDKKLKKRVWKSFMIVSIPVFSLDQAKAYLVINDYCGMCGGGQAIFLERVSGYWKIVKRIDTWVS